MEMTSRTTRRLKSKEKNQPAAARKFDAPFPGATKIRNGSSPSRVREGRSFPEAGKLLPSPLCALDCSGPVPKQALHIRERGQKQRRNPTLMSGKLRQQGNGGSAPRDPVCKKYRNFA
jgi:hypothetical protein